MWCHCVCSDIEYGFIKLQPSSQHTFFKTQRHFNTYPYYMSNSLFILFIFILEIGDQRYNSFCRSLKMHCGQTQLLHCLPAKVLL